MYMPYLHGKQEEMLAISNLGSTLTDLVVPIIKPVSLDRTAAGRLTRLASGSRFALIVNSDRGPDRRPPTYDEVVALLNEPGISANSSNVLPAYELRGDSPLAGLRAFSRLFANRQCVVIHKGHTFGCAQLEDAMGFSVTPVNAYVEPGVPVNEFCTLPSRANILIRNGFSACARNADYPRRSAFDDLPYQFAARGFDGFGDFSIIGDSYSVGGGPAGAVALHLTESSGQALHANHFVSRSVGVDTRTMYFEALDGLVDHVQMGARPGMNTLGVQEYVQSNTTRHFPGLGSAKRWSTMHHIEAMQSVLTAQGLGASF